MVISFIIFHSSLCLSGCLTKTTKSHSILCNMFMLNYAALHQEVLYNGWWNPCINNVAVGELHDVATTGKMATVCKEGGLSVKCGVHGVRYSMDHKRDSKE
jgi:hypothetical protein